MRLVVCSKGGCARGRERLWPQPNAAHFRNLCLSTASLHCRCLALARSFQAAGRFRRIADQFVCHLPALRARRIFGTAYQVHCRVRDVSPRRARLSGRGAKESRVATSLFLRRIESCCTPLLPGGRKRNLSRIVKNLVTDRRFTTVRSRFASPFVPVLGCGGISLFYSVFRLWRAYWARRSVLPFEAT